jgi:hypothetical protein
MYSTKLTLENENGIVSVEVRQSEMTLTDTVRDVIVPVLLAAGYSQATIDDCLHV